MPKAKPRAVAVNADEHEEVDISQLIPPEAREEALRISAKRFTFNVSLIEKKFCRETSGMVLDLDREEIVFDADLCSVQDDKALKRVLKRNAKSALVDGFGSTLLSTPNLDEEEEGDDRRTKRWKQLNKLFESSLNENEGVVTFPPPSPAKELGALERLLIRTDSTQPFSHKH